MTTGSLFVLLLIHAISSTGRAAPDETGSSWQTLNGKPPRVIAREGFSGLFPESNMVSYTHLRIEGMYNLCDLQMTKDGKGICQPDVEISKSTDIQTIFPNRTKTYEINRENVTGYFTIDYPYSQLLENVSVMQSIWSRTNVFDGFPLIPFDDRVIGFRSLENPWVNVPYAQFYSEHKLSIENYLQGVSMSGYHLSSPEIGFLKMMNARKLKDVKLYLVFHEKDEVEPTTKQTYGSILSNLAALKPMVAGIVVPKEYIWPVSESNYLEAAPTTLVAEAHKLGLEVYGSGFANDYMLSYNYSYDPIAEYLNFIRKDQFSLDGFVTDFPPTAASAIECFATFGETRPKTGQQPLIITRGGASGIYSSSTDLAYQQAVDDGADIIDCSVQMTQDGVAFCMVTPDLSEDTTAATVFMDRATSIPGFQEDSGIYSFDLTWSDIQTLKPQLTTLFEKTSGLKRNPAFRNKGKFVTLDDFLEFAKAKAVPGILINIDNAAYLASNKGLDVVTTVITALNKAKYDKKSTQQVFIQSDDTSVLDMFKNVPAYKKVLAITEEISDVPKAAAEEIKKHAEAVTLTRYSIIVTDSLGLTMNKTKVVESLQAVKLKVFVSSLTNEYVTLAFDYYADPTMEIATYTHAVGINGIITEFPGTANRYLRNPCSDLKFDKAKNFILPIEPGRLDRALMIAPEADPLSPPLSVADVVDPSLPKVHKAQEDSPPPAKPAASAAVVASDRSYSTMAVITAVALVSILTR